MADLGDGPLTLKVYRSRSVNRKQHYRWTLTAANGRKIANGGEGYADRTDALAMGEYVVKEHHPNVRVIVV